MSTTLDFYTRKYGPLAILQLNTLRAAAGRRCFGRMKKKKRTVDTCVVLRILANSGTKSIHEIKFKTYSQHGDLRAISTKRWAFKHGPG